MKNIFIEKTADSDQLTDAQLEIINRYTRRALEKNEAFVFSLILCDNEIDRDFERFPRESLMKLAELYKGRTGVFDHAPKAENQSARIFDTALVEEERTNTLGEPYCCLKAWAYMTRSEKNRELIMDIDAGIKKEVSVGCAVEKTVCSVCGVDVKTSDCAHKKGVDYGGKPCHHLLINPTDAYEWSFVAVPAQKNAGVTKGFMEDFIPLAGEDVSLEKLFVQKSGVTLTKTQIDSLCREFKAFSTMAKAGEAHMRDLRREAVKLLLIAQPELPPELAGSLAEKMNHEQLGEFTRALKKSAARYLPVTPQLAGTKRASPLNEGEDDCKFMI